MRKVIDKKKFAPCVLNCPVHININGYIDLIKQKKFGRAFNLILKDLPLPMTIAKICPHPCESGCIRRFKDGAINIHDLRIFLSSMTEIRALKRDLLLPIKNKTNKKVGIIGAGPAGMCCAYFLSLFGHEVFIFDAMHKVGGMLRYGIPKYRLPEDILDGEIGYLLNKNINFVCDYRIDREKFNELKKKFDTFVIATGAWKSSSLESPGNEFLINGIDFLRDVALNKLAKEIIFSKKVAVFGGGNTSIDVARSALRLGAKAVFIIYRRTKKEMPAENSEINEALEEGIILKELLSPVKIVDNKINKILVLEKYKLGENDLDGRPKFIKTGIVIKQEVDVVISAIGQNVDSDFFDGEKNPDGTIRVNKYFQTSYENIFAIGDVINKSGNRIAVKAVADAKFASIFINDFLLGNNFDPESKDVFLYDAMLNKKNNNLTQARQKFESTRLEPKKISPSIRKNNFEDIYLPWSREEFLLEANRCLNCGRCKK